MFSLIYLGGLLGFTLTICYWRSLSKWGRGLLTGLLLLALFYWTRLK